MPIPLRPTPAENPTMKLRNARELKQRKIHQQAIVIKDATMSWAFLRRSIEDNTVNRLTLMPNSDHHLPNAPMVFLSNRTK
ncbi:hypothetical protein [Tardiphaga sp.]|uniref:hypothetical protein n=1 Tax=Tardiphaga sp. TaxID=1926292 RepID=UPI00352AD175